MVELVNMLNFTTRYARETFCCIGLYRKNTSSDELC